MFCFLHFAILLRVSGKNKRKTAAIHWKNTYYKIHKMILNVITFFILKLSKIILNESWILFGWYHISFNIVTHHRLCTFPNTALCLHHVNGGRTIGWSIKTDVFWCVTYLHTRTRTHTLTHKHSNVNYPPQINKQTCQFHFLRMTDKFRARRADLLIIII